MINWRAFSLPVLLLGLLPTSCTQSVTESSTSISLIPNGSFETNHTPTLQGWQFGNPALAKVANEAPANGGNWSLELTADWAPTMGFAYTPVTGVRSGDILRLSAHVRAIGSDGGGSIELRAGRSLWTATSKVVASSDTSWKQLEIVDTVALSAGDTLWVVLSSFHTEVHARKGLFDLVRLERMTR